MALSTLPNLGGLDAVEAMVLVLDPDGLITQCNRACHEVMGQSDDACHGRAVWDFIPGAEVETVRAVFDELLGGRESNEFQNSWLTQDGERRWIAWSNRAYRRADGRLSHVVATGVDVTKLYRAQEALAARETVIRELYQVVATHGDTRADDRIEAMLALGCRHFGLEIGILARIQGQRYEVANVHGPSDIKKGDAFDLADTYCNVTLRVDRPVSFEHAGTSRWRVHPCYRQFRLESYLATTVHVGSEVFGTLNFSSVRPKQERFSATDLDLVRLMADWLGGHMEHNRHARAEELLADAGAILGSSPNLGDMLPAVAQIAAERLGGVCLIDLRTPAGGVRRAAVAASDRSLREVAARLPALPLEPAALDRTAPPPQAGSPMLTGEKAWEALSSLAHTEEEQQLLQEFDPGSLLLLPLAARGHTVGALGALRPIGASPYRIDDIRTWKELARRIGLAIDNAQLYAAAKAASRARDEVVGVVAHDLRNPLTAIKLTSSLIARDPASPEQARAANVVLRSVEEMDALIDDLLDITSIEAGHVQLDRAALRCADLVQEVVERFAPAASARSIALHASAADDLPLVVGDERRVLQILSNLVSNAVKFTSPGGEVIVAAERSEDDDALFSVRDTGPGIAGDHLDHVFDRFWRASRRDGRGAGLGLAIAKGIVEAHGGRIRAESVVGKGSTFTFDLGRRRDPDRHPTQLHRADGLPPLMLPGASEGDGISSQH